MADCHAKGTWGEHHTRKHQGLSLEDTEEWASRTRVNISYIAVILADLG